jgi:hypothetical protein
LSLNAQFYQSDIQSFPISCSHLGNQFCLGSDFHISMGVGGKTPWQFQGRLNRIDLFTPADLGRPQSEMRSSRVEGFVLAGKCFEAIVSGVWQALQRREKESACPQAWQHERRT